MCRQLPIGRITVLPRAVANLGQFRRRRPAPLTHPIDHLVFRHMSESSTTSQGQCRNTSEQLGCRSLLIDATAGPVNLSETVSCKPVRVPCQCVNSVRLPVRSRTKEFVALHEQVQVRILLLTAFGMLTSHRGA